MGRALSRRGRARLIAWGSAAAGVALVAPQFVPAPAIQGGYADLDALVRAARGTGLEGWDLVAWVQDAVHDQFVRRSYRQPWRTPAAAFRDRRGWGMQYNLALCFALRALGFDAAPVFAARVRTEGAPWWRTGHVWVRVRYDGRRQWCCARHAVAPGDVQFVPLSEVWPLHARTRRNLTAVTMVVVGLSWWKARLTGRALPDWVDVDF